MSIKLNHLTRMKYFTASLLASAISARGATGGIRQGNPNASLQGQHGYGYNMGNDYLGGDSHGHYLGHPNGYEQDHGFGNPMPGAAYTANNVHDHVFGYDTVGSIDDDVWAGAAGSGDGLNSADQATLRAAIIVAIGQAQTARVTYIDGVLQKRRDRLQDIHDDNLLKIEAPFDFQLDMLDEELQDVDKAQLSAIQDSTDAFADLTERMDDYEADRIEALNREKDKVLRILQRAVSEGKPVEDVLAALRLDWLAGVYTAGDVAYFDTDVYDKTVFDTEYDMFTFDIGRGKGHGHRDTQQGPGNNRTQGFVVGRGGIGDISQLNGEASPADGLPGRYDKQTMAGHGKPLRPSDYEIGVRQAQAEGAYRYNQAADLGLNRSSGGRRGSAPKRRPSKRAPPKYGKRPSRRPSKRPPTKGYKKTRTYRPKNPVQRTRQISKRTAYDDYAPIRRGRYY
jgi:hypothetical protein